MKLRVHTVFFVASICVGAVSAQDNVLVEGTVRDLESRNPIHAVNITVRRERLGTSTDSLGRFRLILPKGSYVIAFSHIAYDKVIRDLTADHQMTFNWEIELIPRQIPIDEVTVIGKKPFSEQRALWSLDGSHFERLNESDMDRALRYLLPTIISPWDVRMRYPNKDFTLYINGEWKESIYLTDIDPYSVQRVLVWEGEWSPIGLPIRRGRHVVSIETK